jgi:hypothetical protein
MTRYKTLIHYHKLRLLGIRRMKFQASNNLNLVQISSVYPILTPVGQFALNPNQNTLIRQDRRYWASTKCFQKTDMVPVAVSTT